MRDAVNIGYRMLIEILSGKQAGFKPDKFGISTARWTDFGTKVTAYVGLPGAGGSEADRKTMHPSTAAGYIVEDIAGHVLQSWYATRDRAAEAKANTSSMDLVAATKLRPHTLDLQDTEIMKGHSRPDVTSKTLANRESVLLDITSEASLGHILKKVKRGHEADTDWLRFPHVAEVLYPPVDFDDPGKVRPALSAEEAAAIQERILKQQIDNDVDRYEAYLKARDAYYRESIDELNRTRGGRGEDPFALTDTGKSHLETGFTMQIQVDRNSAITSVKLAAFHTTPNGRLLLDAQLFAPPSPNPYIMEPDETERRRRTTSRQATARGGGWKFRDRDPERVRQEYPDRRQARSMADQMRRKRQATPSADEPDSKKPKT